MNEEQGYDRFARSDIGQSFAKLIDSMFIRIEINSIEHLVEKLSDGKFKWNDFTGTLPEVGARIRSESFAKRTALQEAIDRGNKTLEERKQTP